MIRNKNILILAGLWAIFSLPPAVPGQQKASFAREALSKKSERIAPSRASAPGYTLFAPMRSTTTYLIDNTGQTVHTWNSDYTPGLAVYLLPDGNLLRTASLPRKTSSPFTGRGTNGGIIQEIDPGGDVVWEYRYASDSVKQHHDIEPLPNGNILLLAWELKDAAALEAAGANPKVHTAKQIWSEHIVEIKKKGRSEAEIIWEWHAWDHLVQEYKKDSHSYGRVVQHPERIHLNYSAAPRGKADWLHANSVDYNAEKDQILVSIHGFGEVWIIDHSTTIEEAAGRTGGRWGNGGDLLFRWGNPAACGVKGPRQLTAQHDARWIPDGYPGAGNILIFNNGSPRGRSPRSTVLEITPVDYSRSAGVAAEVAWSYGATGTDSFYAQNISGAHRLQNGNTLICSGPQGRFFEVTADDGRTVWEYTCPAVSAGLSGGSDRRGRNRFGRSGAAGDRQRTGFANRQQFGNDTRPGNTNQPGSGSNQKTETDNPVFRATRYAPDYAGLEPYVKNNSSSPTHKTPDSSPSDQSAIVTAPGPSSTAGITYPIVDTNQQHCYGSGGGSMRAPSPGRKLYGQDAQYNGNKPSYTDNGNGTVTDNVTGLMWVKDPGDKVSNGQATTGAASCRVGGYSDWRLPTIKELYSLIDFSGGMGHRPAKPYLDNDYFEFRFGNTGAGERSIDSQYWSASQYVGTTMRGNATVFGVNFADGRIKGYPKSGRGRRKRTQFVRYVRGNTAYGHNDFTDNGDGSVTDRATGLMWAKIDSGKGLNWEQALAYAENLELAGHSDWRLPNAKELQSIVDYTRAPKAGRNGTKAPAIDPIFGITKPESYFWTSTSHLERPGRHMGNAAVYIAFGRAMGYMGRPGSSGSKTFMDVHGAGAQRSDPKTGDPSRFPTGRGPQGDDIRIYNYVRPVRDVN